MKITSWQYDIYNVMNHVVMENMLGYVIMLHNGKYNVTYITLWCHAMEITSGHNNMEIMSWYNISES